MPRTTVQVLGLTLLLASCVARDARVVGAPIPPPTPAGATPTIPATPSPGAVGAAVNSFTANVQPILSRTCAPCHNPGGIMYARMPFDQPRTIRDHAEGVLRRLKGADHEAVAAWLKAKD